MVSHLHFFRLRDRACAEQDRGNGAGGKRASRPRVFVADFCILCAELMDNERIAGEEADAQLSSTLAMISSVARRGNGRSQFVAEGVRTVEELLRSPVAVRGVLRTAVVAESPRGAELLVELARRDIECLEVDDKDFLTAAETEHPQGFLAVADVPAHALTSLTLARTTRLLVLDAIQDPGNTGTLVRTAAALGVAAVVALPGTADLRERQGRAQRRRRALRFRHLHAPGCTRSSRRFFPRRISSPWGADAGGESVN